MVTPAAPAKTAEEMDRELLEGVGKIVEASDAAWDETAKIRVFHPHSEGGLGFASVKDMAKGSLKHLGNQTWQRWATGWASKT